MKKIMMIATILSVMLLASCGKNSGPTGVAEKFLEHTSKGEFEEAKAYCDEPTAGLIGMAGAMITPEKKAELLKKDIKVDMISEEVKDSTAVVKYKVTGEGEDGSEKTIDLKKIKDDWKVSINKEGMR